MYFIDSSKPSICHWFKRSGRRGQLSGGWAQQELSLDGPPLQSLSVDRGRAGAILIDIEYDDGDDDDNDDDDDDAGCMQSGINDNLSIVILTRHPLKAGDL